MILLVESYAKKEEGREPTLTGKEKYMQVQGRTSTAIVSNSFLTDESSLHGQFNTFSKEAKMGIGTLELILTKFKEQSGVDKFSVGSSYNFASGVAILTVTRLDGKDLKVFQGLTSSNDWYTIVYPDNIPQHFNEFSKVCELAIDFATGSKEAKPFIEDKKIPSHYHPSLLDVIDFATSNCYGIEGFYLGNVLKYVARATKKGSYRKDLEKAKHYLDKLLHKGFWKHVK